MTNLWAGIVIVSYNSGKDLQICIDHLAKQTFREFEVIIVDNASPGNEFANLQLPDDRFRIIKNEDNTGFAGGSNFGAKLISAPWVITLNPDAWPDPDWLDALYQSSQKRQEYSILSSTIVSEADKSRLESFGNGMSIFGFAFPCGYRQKASGRPRDDVEVFAACGAAAAYKKDIFDRLGGFDESFFCYLEDIDLAYRFRIAGGKCLQVSDAIVAHIGSSSTNKEGGLKYEYSARNNTALILKNTSLLALPVLLPLYFLSHIWLLYRNREKQNFASRLAGFKSSIRMMPIYWKKRREVFSHRSTRHNATLSKMTWSPRSLRNTPFSYWHI